MERLRRDSHYQHLMLIGAALGMLALFLYYAEGNLNGYRLQLVTLVAINIVIAVALTMSNGFTGVFSLGQMGFVAIGAYTASLITIAPTWKEERFLPRLPGFIAEFDVTAWNPHLALVFACAVGGLLAAGVAMLVGIPLLRLSGNYVAVATIGFLVIVHSITVNMEGVTRGTRGLSQIPALTNPWLAYGAAVLMIYVAWRIRNSPPGRAMIASRDNLIAARAIGINVLGVRLLAFAISAFFSGAAGGLLAHQIGTIAPGAFYFTATFNVVIMVVLGGLGSITGATFGAILMTLAPEYLREVEQGFEFGPLHMPEAFGLAQVILSIVFILVMIFRPGGLFGDREIGFVLFDRLVQRRRPTLTDEEPQEHPVLE
jgi:branched-chain amino acid transport system permease protein